MSVYITGDTHGDLTRVEEFILKFGCTKDDIIAIMGDVGINYYGKENEKSAKKKYNEFGPTLFCIQGNHEERPYNFASYKMKKWNGGIVYYEEEFPNLIFAKDGEIYNLNGQQVLVLGGAYSVDKWYRIIRTYINFRFILSEQLTETEYENALLFIRGQKTDTNGKIRKSLERVYASFPQGICSWFKDEQPSDEIKDFVAKQLEKIENVDAVFSHTCPAKYTPTEMFLSSIDQDSVDHSTENWLDEIEDKLDYKKWYCGHWHTNKKIDKMVFLFEDFVEL